LADSNPEEKGDKMKRYREVKWTRTLLAAAMLMAFWASPATVRALPFTGDQVNDAFAPDLFVSIQFFGPIGQEFTPTRPSLDVVELITTDFEGVVGAPSVGANLFVNIRQSTITGPIAGTSSVALPDHFGGITHFDFPSAVSLVPGNLYVIEAVVTSGDNWGIGIISRPPDSPFSFSTYPGGNVIIFGEPGFNSDMWFREGPVVPEPSTLFLMGSGLAGLAFFSRRSAHVQAGSRTIEGEARQ
jgi:hypothetical protein